MKLLNLVYYFVCPLSILSTLEFRGANLAWDAHSKYCNEKANPAGQSSTRLILKEREEAEEREEGRRQQGMATHPLVRCSWALTLSVEYWACCSILVALPSLESSVLSLPPFLFQEEPPAQDGIQTQCASG